MVVQVDKGMTVALTQSDCIGLRRLSDFAESFSIALPTCTVRIIGVNFSAFMISFFFHFVRHRWCRYVSDLGRHRVGVVVPHRRR